MPPGASVWAQLCLRLLGEPFDALSLWPGDAAAVGSVLVADVRPGILPVAQVLRAQRAAPWCPVCLVVDGSIPAEELCCFEPWPGSFAFAVSAGAFGWPSPASILRAVRSRPRPEAANLAVYVAQRSGVPELEALLKGEVLAPAAAAHPSRRTIARHCTELGSLLPHEWSRLSRLVGWILGSSECDGSLERKAAHAGIDQRTMRRWLDRLLGVSLAQASRTPGWEWILESALRRFGYIEGIPAVVPELRTRRAG